MVDVVAHSSTKSRAAALLRALDAGKPPDSMLDIGVCALCAPTLLELVALVRAQSRARCSREAASAKNAAVRIWVVTAWMTRSDRAQSKGSFGRQHAALVKLKFGIVITERQIAERWLPK